MKVLLLFICIMFVNANETNDEEEFELRDQTMAQRMAEVRQMRALFNHNFLGGHHHRHHHRRFPVARRRHRHHCGIRGCGILFSVVDRAEDEIDYLSKSIHRIIRAEEAPSTPRKCLGKQSWENRIRRKMFGKRRCSLPKLPKRPCSLSKRQKKLIK